MRKLRKFAGLRRPFRPVARPAKPDLLFRRSSHCPGETLGTKSRRNPQTTSILEGARGAATGLTLPKDSPTGQGQAVSRGDLSTWFLRRSRDQTSVAQLHTLELSSLTSN
jgi:hypothetical protein